MLSNATKNIELGEDKSNGLRRTWNKEGTV